MGSTHPTNVPVGAFRCKDGGYVQVQCASQGLHEALARSLAQILEEYKEFPNDPRFANPTERLKHKKEILELLGDVFAKKTVDEWLDLLSSTIPIARVNTIAQSLQEPSVLKRHMVVDIDHPVAGKYKSLGNPLKMGQEEVFTPAPTLGQHNEQVFREVLGYSDEKIQAMKEAKAI